MTGLRRLAPLTLAGAAALSCGALWRFSPGWSVCFLLLALAAVFSGGLNLRFSVFSSLALLLLAVLGFVAGAPPVAQGLVFGEARRYRGEIVEDPSPGVRGYRALVAVEGVAPAEPDGAWLPAAGVVSLTLKVGGERGEEEIPAKGDRVIFRTTLSSPLGFRNPGTLWRELFTVRKGIAAKGFAEVGSTALIARPGVGEAPFSEYRRRMALAVRAAAPGPAGATLASITLGDRSGIDRETVRLFVDTGTIHLLSVSGLHLSIVMLLSIALLRLGLSRFPRLILAQPAPSLSRLAALFPVGAYALIAGLSPATLRSLLMLSVVAAAGALSRRTSTFSVLCTTLFAILAVSPLSIIDPGLQLSFAAIVGLFWLYPALVPGVPEVSAPLVPELWWRRAGRKALQGLRAVGGASLAATLVTAPLASFHFGQGGWSGVAYNCLAVPVSGFVTLPISLAGALCYPVFPWGAEFLWKVAGFSMDFLFWAMALVKLPPSNVLSEAFGSIWGLAGAYFVLLGGVLWRKNTPRWGLAAGLGVAFFLAPPVGNAFISTFERGASLHLFDVEDGLAAAFRFPGGDWVAVDGGGIPGSDYDVGREVVWPALKALGCRNLALVVSTHPHPDHLTGLPTLVRVGKPGEVLIPAAFVGDGRYRELLAAADEVGARVVYVEPSGVERRFRDLSLRIFGGSGSGENDQSLLVEVGFGEVRALVGGDVGSAEQEKLLERGLVTGPVSVYVAAHHGLASAVSARFYRELNPGLTLVSCGERWGGPSRELSALASGAGSPLEATRFSGSLSVDFDGAGFTWAPSPR